MLCPVTTLADRILEQHFRYQNRESEREIPLNMSLPYSVSLSLSFYFVDTKDQH